MSQKVIDMHSHLVPPMYVEALKQQGRLQEDGFPCPSWDLKSHVDYMDSAGIDCCLLSISSPHPVLSGSKAEVDLTRALNDFCGEIARQDPGRFAFAASLPLPCLEDSAEEAARCLDELHAAAVKFPSNAAGVYPGDPRMDPLMEELNRRSALVVLHPCKPPAVPQDCFTGQLLPLFEFLADTTRAVIQLIVSGTVQRFPNVRYLVPHTGSFLPQIVDRLTGISQILAQQGKMEPLDARAALGNFYFDLAGDALPAALPALLTVTTPDHLLFGGDFPYTPAARVCACLEKLRSSPLVQPYLDDIFHRNAERLLLQNQH